jgi:hypothetical protein
MSSYTVDMRLKSPSAVVFEVLFPLLIIVSALRGLFLTQWAIGRMWSMPLFYLFISALFSLLALAFYWYLPKIDIDVRPVLAVTPVLVWLASAFIPLEEVLKSGAVESLTERTMGYMLALPYGFVYVRYVQLSRTLGGKIAAAFFAFLFILWGVAASILREQW